MRFRLFDRVRRPRVPQPGQPEAARARERGSGRHRFGPAADRSPHAVSRPEATGRSGNGPDSPTAADARLWPAGRDNRGGATSGADRASGPASPDGTPPWAERAARSSPYRFPQVAAGRPDDTGRASGPVGDAGHPWWQGPEADGIGSDPAVRERGSAERRGEALPWDPRQGAARARVREWPPDGQPFTSPVRDKKPTRPTARSDARRGAAGRGARDAARRPWYEMANPGAGVAAGRPAGDRARPASADHARMAARTQDTVHYVKPQPSEEPYRADGRRHCGSLEQVLCRQWDAATVPPAEVVRAIDRLAELPAAIKDTLASRLDGIFVGPGGVPDLDDMQHLRGVPLPVGRATWDVCAGAYGGRKIIVGTQPSPTPDVMCHEIGHALDDTGSGGQWLSDEAEFRRLYDQCFPYLVSDFHRQPSGLGRREFFADAFAAIASRQRPALLDMLDGDTRTALNVMLYFNRRFGI